MFETFDHTADLGLRIRAESLEALFIEAATGLFSTIVEDLSSVQPLQQVEITLTEQDRELLLFDWLKSLLYHFDGEHLLFSKFEVTLNEQGLTGIAHGEPLDFDRHQLSHEVKAITYHGLSVSDTNDGFLAEVIVDI